MRNKKLTDRRNYYQDGSSAVLNIALEKEKKTKRKESYYNTGYSHLAIHPSSDGSEQGLICAADGTYCCPCGIVTLRSF